jgi:putative sugar O-methyltransferase
MSSSFSQSDAIEEFLSSFPNFEDDFLLKLDAKHQGILLKLQQEGSLKSINKQNLRNWSGQSDVGAPITFRYLFSAGNFNFKELWAYLGSKSYWFKENYDLKVNLEDDLSIIKLVGGYHLLLKNPVDRAPGHTRWISDGNAKYNLRWLRYIYLAHQIQEFDLVQANGTWVDIGSFYGGLQSIVFKNQRESRCVLVDFHHQLLRSFIFLKEQFPNANHILSYKSGQEIPAGSFVYVPVQNFNELSSLEPDLVSNFFSFGEMTRESFEGYRNSALMKNSKYIYDVNRFISAPFFEPTYDNDINIFDYTSDSHKRIYLDVFPIHHYHTLRRKILNKVRSRNTSSSYFELIQEKKV